MSDTPAPRVPDRRVRFLVARGPTPTDPTRYDAESVWTVPAARAAELIAAGEAEAADLSAVAQPTAIPDPAATAAEE